LSPGLPSFARRLLARLGSRQHVAGVPPPANAGLDVASAVDKIVPLIKPRVWLAQQDAAGGDWLARYVVEDFNDELVVLYAEDGAERIRYLSRAELEAHRVPLQQLRALALENLMRLLPKVSLHKGPLVSMFTAGGCYEASLLLVSDFWASHGVAAPGELIVAAPSRDVILLASSANPAAITRLRELAATSWQQSSHALSQSLFVFRQGRFQVWQGS
jgi:uncharacterized protein YtpQ (UPF0354 family)